MYVDIPALAKETRIVLSSCEEWQEYFASYAGMEGIGAVTDPRKILIDVTRTKLNQNSRTWMPQA